MTPAEIASAVLESALATDATPITLTVRPRRIHLLVQDHRVLVEVVGGIMRVTWVGAPVGGGPATREERVALDDASNELICEIVGVAVRDGITPF